MTDANIHEALISELSANLPRVKPLAPPWRPVLLWLLGIGCVAVALASIANLPAFLSRFAIADMALAMLGSALTAITAIVAAFLSGIPGRSARWSLLPLPPLCLWLGASGIGCLRDWVFPGLRIIPMAETRECLVFILALSVPLTAFTILLLRRSWPVRPDLTACLAGLAVAAAAATLLNLFHPYDASATDLVVHALAVLLVIAGNRFIAQRFFAPPLARRFSR